MKYKYLIALLILSSSLCAANSNGIDNLMPMPKSVMPGEGKLRLSLDFDLAIKGQYDDRLLGASTRFIERLTNRTGLFVDQGIITGADTLVSAELQISITRAGKVILGEDESYQIKVLPNGISLQANTVIGAIRGLQTLFQLISVDELGYYWPAVDIEDDARFKWRGLMIDVSRHFQPIDVIKRNLDGMEAVKLNILHLHLCDDHGYRIESKLYPKLNTVAADGQYYTFEQIKEIVVYADDRGIRVIPEIDVPGHASAILTAYPQFGSKDTTYSLVRNAGIFNPTLNPIKEQTYVFLEEIFGEIAAVFPDEYFHIGGDENEGKHWDENVKIQAFMKDNDLANNHELQTYFNNRLYKILEKNNKKMMGWDEIHTPTVDRGSVIHSWRGSGQGLADTTTLFSAARDGFKTVLSNGYYIDLLNSAENHYLVDPYFSYPDISEEMKGNILGGEATQWSELVTPLTIDTRIWPRMAVIAERFWSPMEVNDVRSMYRRMFNISLLLEHYGLEHIMAQDAILRNLANSRNIEAVRILVDVLEPMKGYSRNAGGFMYSVFDPYTKLADATTADAKAALNLKYTVQDYKAGKVDSYQLTYLFDQWIDNDEILRQLVANSPILTESLPHSINLKLASSFGKEAIAYIESGKKPSKKWYKAAVESLTLADKEQSGRVELQVVAPIAELVEMTQKTKSTKF
ncbi:MAG: beta-N-acetylhexosaminidase [Reichenbachiella sp.]